jgi:hypothetical protein
MGAHTMPHFSWLDTTRRVASMGQREVQIQADGRAAWRAETTQLVCDFFGRRRFPSRP